MNGLIYKEGLCCTTGYCALMMLKINIFFFWTKLWICKVIALKVDVQQFLQEKGGFSKCDSWALRRKDGGRAAQCFCCGLLFLDEWTDGIMFTGLWYVVWSIWFVIDCYYWQWQRGHWYCFHTRPEFVCDKIRYRKLRSVENFGRVLFMWAQCLSVVSKLSVKDKDKLRGTGLFFLFILLKSAFILQMHWKVRHLTDIERQGVISFNMGIEPMTFNLTCLLECWSLNGWCGWWVAWVCVRVLEGQGCGHCRKHFFIFVCVLYCTF